MYSKLVKYQHQLQAYLNVERITWHFILSRTPRFGGIRKSAVDSAKTNLRGILGPSLLTFEEYYTVLSQIEACLNSRRITPMSEDPNYLWALTHGHF